MGLADLPNAKWDLAGDQPICKEDFKFIEEAILEGGGGGDLGNPPLVWVDNASIKVAAKANSPAKVFMSGFPNVINFGEYISADLTDSKQRTVTSDVAFNFAVAATLWGVEKSSQLYALFAIAQDADSDFDLKAMPFGTVKSDAAQVISFGTHVTPATGIGYGFTTNELVGGVVYILSGAQRGLYRSITANNNNSTTGGTVTYGGADLSLSAGDSFIILPPGTNFQYLGCFFNNSSGNITDTKSGRKTAVFQGTGTYFWIILAPVVTAYMILRGGGGGGGGADGGDGGDGYLAFSRPAIIPGEIFKIYLGPGGAGGGPAVDGTAGTASGFYTDAETITVNGGNPGLGDGTPGTPIAGIATDDYGAGGAGAGAGGSAGTDGCCLLSW